MMALATVSLAQDPSVRVLEGLNKTATEGGVSTTAGDGATGLTTVIGTAINYAFGAVAIVFITVIMIGGYFWMASGGKEEDISKAKTFILNGIFGLIVIFLSYALVAVVLYNLAKANTNLN